MQACSASAIFLEIQVKQICTQSVKQCINDGKDPDEQDRQ